MTQNLILGGIYRKSRYTCLFLIIGQISDIDLTITWIIGDFKELLETLPISKKGKLSKNCCIVFSDSIVTRWHKYFI